MPISGDRFRETLGRVPAPVSVVTALAGDEPHGTTVSAFCSLSLRPPLVLVALDRSSDLLDFVEASGRYAVNLLARGQEELATRFARKGADKFAGLDWHTERGLPRLPDIETWLACEVEELLPGGDHVIALGLVTEADCRPAPPLVYQERAFWALAAPQEHSA